MTCSCSVSLPAFRRVFVERPHQPRRDRPGRCRPCGCWQVLAETGRASERERDLPAQVMVYYAIALALYMGSSTREVLRCLLEGLRWLWGAEAVKVAGKSGIEPPQVCRRLQPLRRWSDDEGKDGGELLAGGAREGGPAGAGGWR